MLTASQGSCSYRYCWWWINGTNCHWDVAISNGMQWPVVGTEVEME